MHKIITKLALMKKQYFNYNDIFLKLNSDVTKNKQGKLIVVTSINPTPKGEGKTSLLIGLVDAMNANQKFCIGCLRQPSLGPVFGLKGTATGGNEACLKNDDMINIHFTGDFHAITTANNLISTIIENEIYLNSNLNIDTKKILWKRCEDLNDRSLRKLEINIDKNNSYESGFNITAASDLMMLFCLANDTDDFKNKLNSTIVAFNKFDQPVTIRDLKIADAIMVILKQALLVNVAQTKYDNCILIHGGPFANIAHGCNSIISTKQALGLSDYVITECGFGSDLGFEKFMNIKMQTMNKFPDLVIICATIKSLVYHGSKEIADNQSEQLKAGFKNLLAHIQHVKYYGLEPLVILNIHSDDDLEMIQQFGLMCEMNSIKYNYSNTYNNGPKNTTKLVNQIKVMCNNKILSSKPKYLYDVKNDNIKTKIEKIAKYAYGIENIILSDKLKEIIDNKHIQQFYVCIAKTPYSLSSDPLDINIPNNKILRINDYEINYAANTLVLICDKVFRMPGLNKEPRAKNFKI